MYSQTNQTSKKNKHKFLPILLLLLLLLIGISTVGIYFYQKNKTVNAEINNEIIEIDDDPIEDEYTESYYEGDYTEIVGFGNIDISRSYPNIFLINPEDNPVFLQFDVYYQDVLLYSSDKIAPGSQDSVNVYNKLKPGNYILSYYITSYDLESEAIMMSGLLQNQEITIRS